MNDNLTTFLRKFHKNSPLKSNEIVVEIQSVAGFQLPSDYIEIMKEFNGGEGEIGDNSWLLIYPVEDLIEINDDYKILMEQIPVYFLFGKDAADTGYAFHKEKLTYHSFGLMSDFETDFIDFCGNTFEAFLSFLFKA